MRLIHLRGGSTGKHILSFPFTLMGLKETLKQIKTWLWLHLSKLQIYKINNSITFAYYVTKCAYFQNDVDPTEYVTILLLFSSSVWF